MPGQLSILLEANSQENIKALTQGGELYVISVGGVSGSGKTTIEEIVCVLLGINNNLNKLDNQITKGKEEDKEQIRLDALNNSIKNRTHFLINSRMNAPDTFQKMLKIAKKNNRKSILIIPEISLKCSLIRVISRFAKDHPNDNNIELANLIKQIKEQDHSYFTEANWSAAIKELPIPEKLKKKILKLPNDYRKFKENLITYKKLFDITIIINNEQEPDKDGAIILSAEIEDKEANKAADIKQDYKPTYSQMVQKGLFYPVVEESPAKSSPSTITAPPSPARPSACISPAPVVNEASVTPPPQRKDQNLSAIG